MGPAGKDSKCHVLLQLLCEHVCNKSRQRCTLHDLPGVVVAEFPTRLLLEEVKLGSADGTIPVEVHPVKHLGQGLSVKTGGWVGGCVCGGGGEILTALLSITHTHIHTYTHMQPCTTPTHPHTHTHTIHTPTHNPHTHTHHTPHTCMHR